MPCRVMTPAEPFDFEGLGIIGVVSVGLGVAALLAGLAGDPTSPNGSKNRQMRLTGFRVSELPTLLAGE